MAVSTAKTILEYSTDGTAYQKVCDIISYPDLGSAPSKIDTTDLTATKLKTSILGLQEAPDLTFEANYDSADYARISALTATYTLRLSFGDSDGKFTWTGQLAVFANGGGVDEARKMTIVSSASSEIAFTAGA